MAESALMTSTVPRRQSGATAVEFAAVFPVLFMMIYCGIVYAYIFTLKQSITYAAQEGAEAAVDVQPGVDGYDALVSDAATTTAQGIILWMPLQIRNTVVTDVSFCTDGGGGAACPGVGDAVVVTITLPLTGPSAIFASFALPVIGTFPPLPATMTAQAVARV